MSRSSRPNILFVFADQLRASSLGHVGQEPVLTPCLDAFAQQGLRFTRAVSNAPICSPMRASILTGLHPLSHGMVTNDLQLRQDVTSIAHVLGEQGYRTGYVGKWHLDGEDRAGFTPPGPRRQGFDFWAVANCNHLYMEGYYYRDDPEPIFIDDYEPTGQTDVAIEFLQDSAERGDPFCLFLSWAPPHCPYDQVPGRFRGLYDAEHLAVRKNAVSPDMEKVAGYYAHISALDWNFGRLLDALDALEMVDDTLVIFTSDHGDMLYSQNRGWKCKPWHESVIVPFIARWPGHVPAGATESAPFGLVDVMPTLLDLCGAPAPTGVEGVALPHLLLGQPGPRPSSTPIHFHLSYKTFSFSEWRGVVTERHTYARFRDRAWCLYDDAADPYQQRNLVGDASAAEVEAALESETAQWLERLEDDFPTPDELARRYGFTMNENGITPYHFNEKVTQEQHRRAATRVERMAKA